ncbi:hypothetical protein PFNF135_03034 [Plasmodium falciparum NF135/5.C10]|uniref:Uncharacterized protein n=1 Tax=Plasmodium falciparum NF135/5.C10 TaxID=1036726 RepID=W4IH69_PLAFA|nr:hypothetical protein PFNF135_03034 [Plasmodium falciparum NF135/5.C10]
MVIINNLFLKKKKNELHFFIMRIIKIADLNVIILIYIKRKKKKKKIHIFFVTCVKGLIGEIKDKSIINYIKNKIRYLYSFIFNSAHIT